MGFVFEPRPLSLLQPNRVWLFDPVLSKQEVGVAEQLGCSIIPTNEVGVVGAVGGCHVTWAPPPPVVPAIC